MQMYTEFFNLIDDTLSQFITDTASNTIGAVKPVVNTILLIALGWFSWSSIMGVVDMPIKQLSIKMIQWSVIVSLATNTGLHSQYIVDFFWQLPDALATAIVQNSGSTGSVSSVQYLDELMTRFDDIATTRNQQGITFSAIGASISNLVFSWVIWLAGLFLTMLGAFQLILAKTALAVLIGVSPIFIIMAIFNNTRKFFEAWIGQVLNYAFMPMLTAAFIAIVLKAVNAYLDKLGGVDITDEQTIMLIAITGAAFMLLTQVPAIASSLGGGVAINTFDMERRAGGKVRDATVGMAVGTAKATGKVVGWGYNKYKGKNTVSKND